MRRRDKIVIAITFALLTYLSGMVYADLVATEGFSIDLSSAGAGIDQTIAFDPTEFLGSRTWGDASTDTIVWTWDRATGTDPTITFGNGALSTNSTWTASSFIGALTGNADTVTTNANLTGEVTSTGNSAVIIESFLEDGGASEIAVTAGMMNTGTNASATTFWRGDNTWVTPSGSGDMTKAVYDSGNSGGVDIITSVDSTSATDFLLLTDTAVGTDTVKTDGALTYASTTGTLGATEFVGGGVGITGITAAHAGTITWTGTAILESGAAFQFGDGTDATLTHTYANTGTNTTVAYSSAMATFSHVLEVSGDIGASNLIYHQGDTNTFMRLQDDLVSWQVGGIPMLRLWETTQDVIQLNQDASDVDTEIYADPGLALFIEGSSGDATFSYDLTISGDDLFMGTNTDTALLIADGTNFNPVVPTGDVLMDNTGVVAIQIDTIGTAEMADADHGDVSWSGGVATVEDFTLVTDADAGANKITNLADPILSQDAATKEYVDTATGFQFDYFFSDTASGIGGIYFVMTDVDLGGVESPLATGSLIEADDQPLVNFATLSGDPGIQELSAGVYHVHFHAARTGGNRTTVLYAALYKYELNTSETLLGTTELSNAVTTKTDIELHMSIASEITLLATDRLIIKFFANCGGGSATEITLYQEGDTSSRFTFSTTSMILSTLFVRQDGTTPLTGAWDMGSQATTNVNIDSGTIDHEAGGLETDVSTFSGLLAVSGGSTSEVDAKSELESQIADVADFAEADGDVYTNNHDFGGADLEIPQASPAVPTVDGEIEMDFTDGTLVIQHGSAHAELASATDVVIGKLIRSFNGTFGFPDSLQSEKDNWLFRRIDATEFPHGIVITLITLTVASNTSYTINVENWDDNDTINGANGTIDEVAYTADGTGEKTEDTITYSTIGAGQIIQIDLPTTDVSWISVHIEYYEPAA